MEEGKPSPMCKYRVRLLEKIEFEFSVFNMEERRNAWVSSIFYLYRIISIKYHFRY